MRELISKLVAGGLSAAVILLWWPRFFPSEDATTWLIRGVLWTLSFELLLHALLPVERALWESRAGAKVRAGASRARTRSPRGRAVVACGALGVPLALLTFAPAPPVKSSAGAPVRRVTEVKRIVKVERKQVRVAKVVPVPAASAPSAVPAPSSTIGSEQRRPAKRTAKRPLTTGSVGGAPENTGGKGDGSTAPPAGQSPDAGQQPVSSPRVVRRARPA